MVGAVYCDGKRRLGNHDDDNSTEVLMFQLKQLKKSAQKRSKQTNYSVCIVALVVVAAADVIGAT